MGHLGRHPIRNIVAAAAVAMILTMTGPAAAAGPSQNSRGDRDSLNQLDDAGWLMQNQRGWGAVHHPGWNENYREISGQIGDFDRMRVWHYGAGGFDRNSTGLTIDELASESPKARVTSIILDAFVKKAHKSQGAYESN
jgi:hypothetical protein